MPLLKTHAMDAMRRASVSRVGWFACGYAGAEWGVYHFGGLRAEAFIE